MNDALTALQDHKAHVDLYYDDDMCCFLDPTVKPTQLRAAMLNELKSLKPWPRVVSWDRELKRAVSIQLKKG